MNRLARNARWAEVASSAVLAAFLAAQTASAQDGATPTKAPAKAVSPDAKGECHGINACKGKGECGSKTTSCAGTNECKGKGWTTMTKKECDAKKGKFKPDA